MKIVESSKNVNVESKIFVFLFISNLFVQTFGDYNTLQSLLSIPLAPYHVKLFCQSNRASQTNGHEYKPILCPTASTACGYFEFLQRPRTKFYEPKNALENKNQLMSGIYECVDTSIFMEELDEEQRLFVDFSNYCDHRTRCHDLPMTRLNKQFLNYLIDTYNLKMENLVKNYVRFCCSLNHGNLKRIIDNGYTELRNIYYLKEPMVLALPKSLPVICGGNTCSNGAIGCLLHEMLLTKDQVPSWESTTLNPSISNNFTTTIQSHIDDIQYSQDDYLDVKPVELVWPDYDEMEGHTSPHEMSKQMDDSVEMKRVSHCVFPHLNTELYRYCLMIYAQNTTNKCWIANQHRICCCFVGPNETTCTPDNSRFPYFKIHQPKALPDPSTKLNNNNLTKTITNFTIPKNTTESSNIERISLKHFTSTIKTVMNKNRTDQRTHKSRHWGGLKNLKIMKINKTCRAIIRKDTGSNTYQEIICDDYDIKNFGLSSYKIHAHFFIYLFIFLSFYT